jgi:hypothetical protein
MTVLATISPHAEHYKQYSIDEIFLNIFSIDSVVSIDTSAVIGANDSRFSL